IGLDLDTGVLDDRIAARVDGMWAAGFVEEGRSLLPYGLRAGLTASRALGYQQVLAYLDGTVTEAEAYADTVRGTRRFVRRQRSWFKRDGRIVWLSSTGPDAVEKALALVQEGTA